MDECLQEGKEGQEGEEGAVAIELVKFDLNEVALLSGDGFVDFFEDGYFADAGEICDCGECGVVCGDSL